MLLGRAYRPREARPLLAANLDDRGDLAPGRRPGAGASRRPLTEEEQTVNWRAVAVVFLVAGLFAPAVGQVEIASDNHWFLNIEYSGFLGPGLSDELIESFKEMLDECASRSATFRTLVTDDSISPKPTIELIGTTAQGFGSSVGSKQLINMAGLMRLPLDPPEGNTRWCPTRCSILGHEIAEVRFYRRFASKLARIDDNCAFQLSHQDAIGAENRIRVDQGQSECRMKGSKGDRVEKHLDHEDAVLRFGGHSFRMHRSSPLDFDLETGMNKNNCEFEGVRQCSGVGSLRQGRVRFDSGRMQGVWILPEL